MIKYKVYLKHCRHKEPIIIENVLAGTIVQAPDGNTRLKLFTIDGKTHMFQTDLYQIKITNKSKETKK